MMELKIGDVIKIKGLKYSIKSFSTTIGLDAICPIELCKKCPYGKCIYLGKLGEDGIAKHFPKMIDLENWIKKRKYEKYEKGSEEKESEGI